MLKSQEQNNITRKFLYRALRADIDYGFAEAHTTYGILGVEFGFTKVKSLNVADGRRKRLLNKRLTITDAITEDAAIEDRREGR